MSNIIDKLINKLSLEINPDFPYIVECITIEQCTAVASYIKGYDFNFIREYRYIINHKGLLNSDHRESNIDDEVPTKVKHLPIMQYDEWFYNIYIKTK